MDEDKNREQRLSKATTESEDWDSDFISSVDDLSSFESNSLKQLEDYDDIESDSDAGKSTVSPLLEGCFKKLSFWDDGNKTLKGKLTSESHDSLAVGTSNQRTPTWKEEEFGKELSSRLNGGAGSRNLGEDESDFEYDFDFDNQKTPISKLSTFVQKQTSEDTLSQVSSFENWDAGYELETARAGSSFKHLFKKVETSAEVSLRLLQESRISLELPMIIPVAFNSGNTEQKFTTVDGQCDWLKSIIEVSIEKAKDYLKGETVQQKKDNLVKELNNLQKLSQIPADNWCSYYMECCELLFCFEEPLPLRTSLEFYFHQLKEKRRAACDGVISHSLLQMASLSHHEKNSPVMNHLCSSEDPYTALVSIVLSEFPLMSVPVYLLELEQKSIAYKCRISSLNEVLEKLCKLYAAFSTDSTLRSFSDPPLERLVAKLPSLAPEWLSQYVFTKEFALASTLCDFQLLLNGVNPLTFEFYGVNTEEDSASSESSLPSECMKILSDSSKKSEEFLRELYTKFPSDSLIRRKCLIALALLYTHEEQNPNMSESFLYECLWDLGTHFRATHKSAKILSLQGRNLLRLFTRMLPSKNRLGTVFLEEALKIDYFFHTNVDEVELKRLCVACGEQQDPQRALFYCSKMVKQMQDSKKRSEAVHVLLELSGVMANYGHFSLAEVLIHGATAMIESVEGSDSTKLLNSRIRLATIFLSSGQYDRAISVIEALLLASVPAHCRAHFELLLLLSEALIKHDWLRESHEVLGLFPRNKRTLGGPCGHVHSYKSLQQTPEDEPDDDFYETFECARYNRKLVIKEELQNVSRDLLFKFWCLCGKSLLKNNECLRAFDAYNEALAFCSKENLSQSGQVFYKKGKVLHALLQTNSRCVMPLVIREGKEECKIKSFSELSLRCVALYKNAQSCFRAVGDDYKVSIVFHNIALLLLDQCFAPVCLSCYPKEDFVTSEILEQIEFCAQKALGFATNNVSVFFLIHCFLNLAEVRLLLGDESLSRQFFDSARFLYMDLFGTGDGLIFSLYSHSVNFLKKLFKISKRLVRYLFCCDSETINKNLYLLDLYLRVQSLSGLVHRCDPSSVFHPIRTSGLKTFPLEEQHLLNTFSEFTSEDVANRHFAKISTIDYYSQQVAFTEKVVCNSLYRMSANLKQFRQGSLDLLTLKDRNTHVLREAILSMSSLRAQNRNVNSFFVNEKVQSPSEETLLLSPMRAKTYKEMTNELPSLKRVCYLLRIEEYVLLYSPRTTMKRAVRVGGRALLEIRKGAAPGINMFVKLINGHQSDSSCLLKISPSSTFNDLTEALKSAFGGKSTNGCHLASTDLAFGHWICECLRSEQELKYWTISEGGEIYKIVEDGNLPVAAVYGKLAALNTTLIEPLPMRLTSLDAQSKKNTNLKVRQTTGTEDSTRSEELDQSCASWHLATGRYRPHYFTAGAERVFESLLVGGHVSKKKKDLISVQFQACRTNESSSDFNNNDDYNIYKNNNENIYNNKDDNNNYNHCSINNNEPPKDSHTNLDELRFVFSEIINCFPGPLAPSKAPPANRSHLRSKSGSYSGSHLGSFFSSILSHSLKKQDLLAAPPYLPDISDLSPLVIIASHVLLCIPWDLLHLYRPTDHVVTSFTLSSLLTQRDSKILRSTDSLMEKNKKCSVKSPKFFSLCWSSSSSNSSYYHKRDKKREAHFFHRFISDFTYIDPRSARSSQLMSEVAHDRVFSSGAPYEFLVRHGKKKSRYNSYKKNFYVQKYIHFVDCAGSSAVRHGHVLDEMRQHMEGFQHAVLLLAYAEALDLNTWAADLASASEGLATGYPGLSFTCLFIPQYYAKKSFRCIMKKLQYFHSLKETTANDNSFVLPFLFAAVQELRSYMGVPVVMLHPCYL